jgi:DNA modification methylase
MVWAKLYVGDTLNVLKTINNSSVDLAMTSPPYWGLRDYGVKGQLGLEATSDEYIQKIIQYFDELKRVIKPTGSFYLNLGDTYMKKNLQMIPARLTLLLQEHGWTLRNDIIWHKPNHMPASVKDRLSNTYEHLFHFVKSKRYYYDLDSIRIPHKTGPASFNYRVREAKRNHTGIIGVKSNSKEMSEYDNKGQRIQKLKDQTRYDTKFSKRCQASSLLARTAYARKVLGRNHETALNHPLGKNPGDTVSLDWAEGRRNNCMPAFPPQHKDKITRGYRDGKGAAGINPHMRNHPLGKNPGDVIPSLRKSQQLYLDTKGRIGHGHYKGGVYVGIRNHRLGKNPGDFWNIPPKPFPGAHFAVYPETLCIAPIKSSCPPGGVVLDPFAGSGTTMKVALELGRNTIGIELNPKYARIIESRLGTNCKPRTYRI